VLKLNMNTIAKLLKGAAIGSGAYMIAWHLF